MKSLIVGMGIGQLYKTVLTQLGHEICTVDSDINKNADFPNVDPAILLHRCFDTVHICTPNFTHLELAVRIAPVSKIVFIEKPGVINRNEWAKLCKRFPRTRFIMVKNNMWRDNIPELQKKASIAKNVDIEWIRRNCIPSPGSWFTTRKLAFGGVSRDLMPHLLSLYIALNPEWRTEKINGQAALQNWLLENIESTEYGTVNPNGTYDVDDQCNIHFGNKWNLRANWRSIDIERSAITFINQDNSRDVFELGWCPEEAYLNMIKDAVENLNNDEYWKVQLEIDLWIHERIENL
jgi:predicted dehydrogenase